MSGRLEIARDCYMAYALGERDLVARHLAANVAFYSPADPGIDRETYFERCWPNAESIADFDFIRLVESDDEVFVTYEATRADGSRFRNAEVLTFAGEKVVRTEVYFGWELPSSLVVGAPTVARA